MFKSEDDNQEINTDQRRKREIEEIELTQESNTQSPRKIAKAKTQLIQPEAPTEEIDFTIDKMPPTSPQPSETELYSGPAGWTEYISSMIERQPPL